MLGKFAGGARMLRPLPYHTSALVVLQPPDWGTAHAKCPEHSALTLASPALHAMTNARILQIRLRSICWGSQKILTRIMAAIACIIYHISNHIFAKPQQICKAKGNHLKILDVRELVAQYLEKLACMS